MYGFSVKICYGMGKWVVWVKYFVYVGILLVIMVGEMYWVKNGGFLLISGIDCWRVWSVNDFVWCWLFLLFKFFGFVSVVIV